MADQFAQASIRATSWATSSIVSFGRDDMTRDQCSPNHPLARPDMSCELLGNVNCDITVNCGESQALGWHIFYNATADLPQVDRMLKSTAQRAICTFPSRHERTSPGITNGPRGSSMASSARTRIRHLLRWPKQCSHRDHRPDWHLHGHLLAHLGPHRSGKGSEAGFRWYLIRPWYPRCLHIRFLLAKEPFLRGQPELPWCGSEYKCCILLTTKCAR